MEVTLNESKWWCPNGRGTSRGRGTFSSGRWEELEKGPVLFQNLRKAQLPEVPYARESLCLVPDSLLGSTCALPHKVSNCNQPAKSV